MAKKLAKVARNGAGNGNQADVARGRRSMGNAMNVAATSGTENIKSVQTERTRAQNYPGNMTPKGGQKGVDGRMRMAKANQRQNYPGTTPLKNAKKGM